MSDQIKALEKKIDRLNEKLTVLLNKPTKKTWVKVSIVSSLTGWDFRAMAKARDNGLIEYRKDESGIFTYALESIPEIFIKSKTLN